MRVITYTDPRRLHLHQEWHVISSFPHVCATESLTRGLQAFYGPSGGQALPAITAVSANMLLSKLLPRWLSAEDQTHQYALLGTLLRDLQTKSTRDVRLVRAFRRNQKDVLNSLRLLTECGLRASDLAVRTPEERLLVEVWDEMERIDPRFNYIRTVLSVTLRNRNKMRRELVQAFADSAAALREKYPTGAAALDKAARNLLFRPKLIFHGFYFITPIQQQFIELLENAGVELVFLCCWDGRRAPIFDAWQTFFPQVSGSQNGPNPEDTGAFFASTYMGANSPSEPPKSLRVIKFPDLGAFLAHIHQEEELDPSERERLCSPKADELNDVLKEFYPERYPDRHFLSYPIGQFVMNLVRMIDDDSAQGAPLDRRLRIAPEALFDCFASGLLRTRVRNRVVEGRALTGVLQKMLPFFEGCEYLADWRARGNQLKSAVQRTVKADSKAVRKGASQRFHRLLTNPFRLVSYLNVSEAEIEDVMLLIERLFAMAEKLYSSEKTTPTQYLRTLVRLLEEQGVDESLRPEELQLFKSAVKTLVESRPDDDKPLAVADLGDALAFYLGAIAEQSDDKMVAPLAALDGLPLEERSRPIHLCMLTQDTLPVRTSPFPWPLSRESFRNPNHSAVQLLIKREESSPQASLFLFYSALAYSRQVTLSWIETWHGEQTEESCYLLMLDAAGIKPVRSLYGPWTRGADVKVSRASMENRPELADIAFPPHAVAEFTLCPRRFYYSYIASEGPEFSSSFHLELLYSGLYAWLRRQGMDPERAAEELAPLFPQFTAIRKQDTIERYGSYGEKSDEYDGKEYPNDLRRLVIPGCSRDQKVKRVFSNRSSRELLEDNARLTGDQMAALPDKHCRYCPHISCCRDALYPVDS